MCHIRLILITFNYYSRLNGGCEDICKVNNKGQAECQCLPGRYLIDPNGKRCAYTRRHCENELQFQCSQSLDDSPICIPYNLTCDGLEHCPDGSDENVPYCAIRRCKKGFFQCTNNKCILEDRQCNGLDECGDYSDEEGCPCPKPDMFRCTKGPCIPKNERCNSRPDCIDASDEIGKYTNTAPLEYVLLVMYKHANPNPDFQSLELKTMRIRIGVQMSVWTNFWVIFWFSSD